MEVTNSPSSSTFLSFLLFPSSPPWLHALPECRGRLTYSSSTRAGG